MRTTIAVDDKVLEAAKVEARQEGQSLGKFIESAIQRELARRREPSRDRPLIPTFTRGTGVRPGVDITSNRTLLEVLDETKPVEELR